MTVFGGEQRARLVRMTMFGGEQRARLVRMTMFGGEQRARLVQSSPAKAGYATAGRMTMFSESFREQSDNLKKRSIRELTLQIINMTFTNTFYFAAKFFVLLDLLITQEIRAINYKWFGSASLHKFSRFDILIS